MLKNYLILIIVLIVFTTGCTSEENSGNVDSDSSAITDESENQNMNSSSQDIVNIDDFKDVEFEIANNNDDGYNLFVHGYPYYLKNLVATGILQISDSSAIFTNFDSIYDSEYSMLVDISKSDEKRIYINQDPIDWSITDIGNDGLYLINNSDTLNHLRLDDEPIEFSNNLDSYIVGRNSGYYLVNLTSGVETLIHSQPCWNEFKYSFDDKYIAYRTFNNDSSSAEYEKVSIDIYDVEASRILYEMNAEFLLLQCFDKSKLLVSEKGSIYLIDIEKMEKSLLVSGVDEVRTGLLSPDMNYLIYTSINGETTLRNMLTDEDIPLPMIEKVKERLTDNSSEVYNFVTIEPIKWIISIGLEELEYSKELNISASSILGPLYSEGNLTDGDINTCWSEGVDGQGIGESVSIKPNFIYENSDEVMIVDSRKFSSLEIGILNGYCKTLELYESNSKIKSFDVYVNGSFYSSYNLDDIYNEFQSIFIENTDIIDEIIITITDIYEGTVYDDCCVSEMVVYN